ncbi:MAG TPA: Rrf2 family transcriptional regulator [Terriglobales bacterium]|nr:Rrf2 family transcriptional regulator [Terriglobales bacterium]
MQITRASDYAVRVVIHLAGLPVGSTVRRSELARVGDVPEHFLSKVLQRLVHSGMVRSQRGAGGGFSLAVPAAKISMLDVVQAIEGPIRMNQCLIEGPSCERKAWCPAHQVWAETQDAVLKILGAASMEQLAAQATPGSTFAYRNHEKAITISGVSGTGRRTPG